MKVKSIVLSRMRRCGVSYGRKRRKKTRGQEEDAKEEGQKGKGEGGEGGGEGFAHLDVSIRKEEEAAGCKGKWEQYKAILQQHAKGFHSQSIPSALTLPSPSVFLFWMGGEESGNKRGGGMTRSVFTFLAVLNRDSIITAPPFHRHHSTRQHKSSQAKPNQTKKTTRQDKTRQSQDPQDNHKTTTRQPQDNHKTRHDKTRQDKIRQNSHKTRRPQDRTKQEKTRQPQDKTTTR